jgi:hypothetical protein
MYRVYKKSGTVLMLFIKNSEQQNFRITSSL